jgi:hypothetical protein
VAEQAREDLPNDVRKYNALAQMSSAHPLVRASPKRADALIESKVRKHKTKAPP